jgi:hypothetical protein
METLRRSTSDASVGVGVAPSLVRGETFGAPALCVPSFFAAVLNPRRATSRRLALVA